MDIGVGGESDVQSQSLLFTAGEEVDVFASGLNVGADSAAVSVEEALEVAVNGMQVISQRDVKVLADAGLSAKTTDAATFRASDDADIFVGGAVSLDAGSLAVESSGVADLKASEFKIASFGGIDAVAA
eukprot:COSAG01_NODE_47690_length_388_cov_0.532872_1_plen_128_part_11